MHGNSNKTSVCFSSLKYYKILLSFLIVMFSSGVRHNHRHISLFLDEFGQVLAKLAH